MKMQLLFTLLLSAVLVRAAIVTQTVEYKHGDVICEGYLAHDDATNDPKPGVIVVHDWMGNGPFSKLKAEELAKLGYVGFAIDVYGKGVRPQNPKEAAEQAGKFKQDRKPLRERVNAALTFLRTQKMVDPRRIAAMGYCFGGMAALELGRSGADILGIVSFHGSLDSPTPADGKNIKAKVLVLHGADDPHVPDRDVAAFESEMRGGGVDWQLVKYGNAVHAFTNPTAGNDNSKGAAYNEKADRRSWQAMKDFLAEILAAK
ncbi:MAG TPA: dienelactone hydrolase family protein [Planctomycetota bacterium]|jgi:dienelactone hydrolase